MLNSTLRRYTIRRLLSNPIQLVLTILSIAISVAIFLGVLSAYRSSKLSLQTNESLIRIEKRSDSASFENLSEVTRVLANLASIKVENGLVEIRLENKRLLNTIVASLRTAIDPSEFKVSMTNELSADISGMLEALSANLFILVSLLAVLSCLVIAGSAELSLLESASEIKSLLLNGVQRWQIVVITALQVLSAGLAGSLIGILGGSLANKFVAQYFNASALQLQKSSLSNSASVDIYEYIAAFGFGVLISSISAFHAAIHVEGIKRRHLKKSIPKISTWSCLFILMALALTTNLTLNERLQAFILSALILLLGGCLVTSFSKILLTPFRTGAWLSPRLASALLARLWRWTLLPMVSICCGLTLLVSLAVMITSFENTFSKWLGSTLDKDIYLKALNDSTVFQPSFITSSAIDFLRTDQRVDDLEFYSTTMERSGNYNVLVSGTTASLDKILKRYNLRSANIKSATKEFETGKALLINEILSRKMSLSAGDKIELLGQDWDIIGTYRDYAGQFPTALISFAVLESRFGQKNIISASLNAISQQAQTDLLSELRERFKSEIAVYSSEQLSDEALRIFHQTFEITKFIRALMIALVSTSVLLFLSQACMQERRGFRTLQILGLSSFMQGRLFVSLGLCLSLPAIIFGLPTGIMLGYVLVNYVNPASFGWTIDFSLSPNNLLLPTFMLIISIISAAMLAWIFTKSKIKSTSILGYEE